LNKKNQLYSIGLLVWLLSFTGVNAQTRLELIPDTNAIRIGEQINLDIVVSANQNDTNEITWPIAADTLTGKIDVVIVNPVDTLDNAGLKQFTQQWVVTSFDSGQHVVPPFQLVINGEEFETEPFLIHVETMEVDTTQAIKSIKNVEGVPISFLDWIKYHWQLFAGLGVLAILVFGVYIILKKRKKVISAPVVKPAPIIPPHITALKRLDELQKAKYWQQDEIKKHHSEISEILREYLEFQFAFPALEQTTEEVMQAIRLTEISSEQQKRLRRMLMLSDLVKYAKEKPGREENIEMLDLATVFVNESKPADEPIDNKEKEEGNEA
jgi:hypothetical protein